MGFFSFFKNPDPIQDEDLGRLTYEHREWFVKISLPTGDVELAIHGDKNGPDPFARNYWTRVQSRIPQLWIDAMDYSKVKLKEWGWEDEIQSSQFELATISIHPENSFDGGHLSFWFEVRPDENGSYYVSFCDEKPTHFHRDS